VDRWNRLDEIIARAEQFLLAIMLSFMILVAFLQIVLRNFFATGLTWADPLVRYLVLWAGFTGAALATREGRHIKIDVLSQWLPGLSKRIVSLVTNLFSFFICGVLAYAAFVFIRNEAQISGTTFLAIPIWIPQLIICISFGLMALRFGFHALGDFLNILNPDKDPGSV
jgi:TRAP-type C4-dicarboxylate transport system permease small subunit